MNQLRKLSILSLLFSLLLATFSPAYSAGTNSTQRVNFEKSIGLLGHVDGTDRSKDWAKYYGDGLAFIDSFANVGSTVTLTWTVTSDGKSPLANTSVKFLVNKACSSSNGKVLPIAGTTVSSGSCGVDGASINGITDANGEVSFTITNGNTESEAEVRPSDFSKLSAATLRRYSQVTLLVKDQLKESIDIVDIHWVKTTNEPAPTKSAETSTLIWSQEFNGKKGATVDSKYWNYDLGGNGWGNGELQNYQKDAVAMDGKGNLVITAKKLVGNKKSFCLYGFCQYSSGRILTKDKLTFKYGKIEARIKMPSGSGTWPAFWTLGTNIKEVGWPKCGEIDIIEAVGNNPKWVSVALHGPEYSGGSNIGRSFLHSSNLSAGYHTYGIEWLPGQISWTFDGKVIQTVNKAFIGDKTWVFDAPHYILLNIAMGGTLGGEISPKFTSATMAIDWVRVSKLGEFGEVITN